MHVILTRPDLHTSLLTDFKCLKIGSKKITPYDIIEQNNRQTYLWLETRRLISLCLDDPVKNYMLINILLSF